MCVNSFISLKKDDISESIATVVKFPGIPDRESGGAEFPGIPEWEFPVALMKTQMGMAISSAKNCEMKN